MSKGIHNTPLTIVRSTHLARDAVLFSVFGFFFPAYWYLGALETLSFLIWLIDLIGLLFLWIPRERWQQVGYGWSVLMSLGLLFIVFSYSGSGPLIGGLIVILILCMIEILVVLKISYDLLKSQSESWTADAD